MKQLSLQRKHKITLVALAEGKRGDVDERALKELVQAGYVLDGKLTGIGQQIARDLIHARNMREAEEKTRAKGEGKKNV